jgi:hypothetical protein
MLNFLQTNLMNYCDAPSPWGLYFQDSATPQMEGLVELHNNIMFYLAIILFGVGWILASIVRTYTADKSPISHKYLNHGKMCHYNDLIMNRKGIISVYNKMLISKLWLIDNNTKLSTVSLRLAPPPVGGVSRPWETRYINSENLLKGKYRLFKGLPSDFIN